MYVNLAIRLARKRGILSIYKRTGTEDGGRSHSKTQNGGSSLQGKRHNNKPEARITGDPANVQVHLNAVTCTVVKGDFFFFSLPHRC